jgi:hypothetical protein
MWRPTSPGNEDVLICINAPYMTQRVLKPWWQWTYQNSAVKRAAARAIPGWVTSWEVWYGEPKADNIVSLGVGRYNKSVTILCTSSANGISDPLLFIWTAEESVPCIWGVILSKKCEWRKCPSNIRNGRILFCQMGCLQ